PGPQPAVVLLHLIGQPDPAFGPELPVGHDVAEPSGRGGDEVGGALELLVLGEGHQELAAGTLRIVGVPVWRPSTVPWPTAMRWRPLCGTGSNSVAPRSPASWPPMPLMLRRKRHDPPAAAHQRRGAARPGPRSAGGGRAQAPRH